MIVVVLVAVLALLAAPAMRVARDDRMAFDYARQIQQMTQRARARASGRGAAQLIVAGPSGGRGRVQMWEALDNTTPASGGPNPISSCKAANQWATVQAYVPGVSAVGNTTRIIDGLDLNTAGVNVDADIKADFSFGTTAAFPLPAAVALAICVTPNGTTFASDGTDINDAIAKMQANPPFTGAADIRITRNRAGAPVGLARHVLITGSAAARIQSR